MKLAIATVLSTAALLGAAPAAASPGSIDSLFLEKLDEYGISYSTPSAAVRGGHLVCEAFDDGLGFETVLTVISHATGLSFRKTGRLIGLSVAAYCPDHVYQLDV